MSALYFVVQCLIHCQLGKTNCTLVLNKTNKSLQKPGILNAARKVCDLLIKLVKIELVSQHTKVQASALQTFADVFVDCNKIRPKC